MFYMTYLLYQALYIDFQVFAKLRHLFLGQAFIWAAYTTLPCSTERISNGCPDPPKVGLFCYPILNDFR